MSTQHTPGPWAVGKFNPSHVYQKGKNVTIARCEADICYTEEDKANARLIAAAPELLEALEGLVSLENEIRRIASFSHETSMKYLNARAAIEKATTNPDNIHTGEPDPTDLARDYNEATEYANQPTEYDP